MRYCIECTNELEGNRTKYCDDICSRRFARRKWVRQVYNISLEEYDVILDYQGGVCYICQRRPRDNETFVIDHEHGGIVRGILCGFCNLRVVGKLRDAVKAMRLAEYLINPPAVAALGREVVAPGRPKKKRQPRKRRR